MKAAAFLVMLFLAGCSGEQMNDSAAVHIDKLHEEISELRRERDSLQSKLHKQELEYDRLMLAMSRFKKAAIAEPALAIGRYLRALRRFEFDIALRHPSADLSIKPYLQEPAGGVLFLFFASRVREAGGEIPEGISTRVDLSMLSSSQTEQFSDVIALDKAIAKATSEDEINRIYFEREMNRLGEFSKDILSH